MTLFGRNTATGAYYRASSPAIWAQEKLEYNLSMALITNILYQLRIVTFTILGTRMNYMSRRETEIYLNNTCKGYANTWNKINY